MNIHPHPSDDDTVSVLMGMTACLVPQAVPVALRDGWRLTLAPDAQTLVEQAMSEDFDLVLLDAWLPGRASVPDAQAAAELLARAGCGCPLLRLDALPAPWAPPFLASLVLPLDEAALQPHIARAQARRRALARQIGPASLDPAVAELGAAFRARLPDTLARLAEAARRRDLATLGAINHVLKGSGTTHGLPQLTRRGAEIATLLATERQDEAIERTLALVACVHAELQGPATP